MITIILILVLLIWIVIILFLCWKDYVYKTKIQCNNWGYGNYKTFIKEFNHPTYSWKFDFNKYEFYSGDYCKITTDIIKFNNKGMVLDFIQYIRFLHWFKFSQPKSVIGNKTEDWK